MSTKLPSDLLSIAVYTSNGSEPTPLHKVSYIAENLRAIDRLESELMGVPRTPEYLTAVAEASKLVVIASYRGAPAFAAGLIEILPGVFSVWGYGTEHTSKVAPGLSRLAPRIRDYLFRVRDARRVQVALPNDPRCYRNIAWLADLGFIPESISRCACIDGGDLVTLAFTQKDFDQYVSISTHAEGSESPSGPESRSSTH